MNYNLIITATAEDNILNACFYYDTQQIGLSERFLAELETAYDKISSNPDHYSYVSSNPDDKYRDIKLYKFPFVIIYEVRGDDVIVIAVFNTHRKPQY